MRLSAKLLAENEHTLEGGVVLGEQQTEGSSQDPKGLAKTMLQEGADIEAIMAETNLSKPTILGLKGLLLTYL